MVFIIEYVLYSVYIQSNKDTVDLLCGITVSSDYDTIDGITA